ncbi:MAG: hypothetical protein QM534_00295 [Sediminibacterium sp.]|nr:hypothetical protein [Sediminibacterium sp.]
MKKNYIFILMCLSLYYRAQNSKAKICFSESKKQEISEDIKNVRDGDQRAYLVVSENYEIRSVGLVQEGLSEISRKKRSNSVDVSEIIKKSKDMDSIYFTYKKKGGVFSGVKKSSIALNEVVFRGCKGDMENDGCDNQINNIKYILDLCQKDVCSGVRLPALICNDRTVFNRKLKLPHRSMLSFGIINNNPFRYSYSINQNRLSFNTDGSQFLEGIGKMMDEAKSTASLVPSGTSSLVADDKQKVNTVKDVRTEVETILKESEKLLEDLKVYSTTIAMQQCLSKTEVEGKLHEFTSRHIKITGSSTFQNKIEELVKKLKDLDRPATGDNKVDSVLILNAINQLQKYTFKDIEKGLGQLIKGTYNYELLPIQVSDDNVDAIELEVQQEDKLTGRTDTYKYAFYISGGIKIDFTAGPFVSTLTDHKYKLNDKYIMRQRDDEVSYSLASLMHVYFRTTSHFNSSLYLGVGVTDDQRANLMTGVSLMFGRKDRVCLNGGIAFGKVKRLSQPYQMGSEYTGKDEIPVIDVYKMGWSFGITYNLTKPKVLKPQNQ